MAHGHYEKTLPADLSAPDFVNGWRSRALMVGGAFSILGIILGFLANDGWSHFLRAWLMGFMISFGFCCGGMALLMVQYLSGGKWGLLVRRPLEAMTRTLPLVFIYFLPVGIFGVTFKKLYLWAKYPDTEEALKNHLITAAQAHAIHFKHGLLNPTTFWIVSLVCFASWALYIYLLN